VNLNGLKWVEMDRLDRMGPKWTKWTKIDQNAMLMKLNRNVTTINGMLQLLDIYYVDISFHISV